MNEILLGDCLEVMKTFPDNHFSGIVTDPPYGLHFMGKDWDCFKKTNFDERGDYKHLENSSVYNINRDVRSIKSANTSSGEYDDSRNDEFQSFITQFGIEAMRIVKPGGHILMCGAPRRYHRQACGLEDAGWKIRDCLCWLFGSGFPKSHNRFGAEGYGTALKPAYEPILLAMKPLDGTFAHNYLKWGVGGLNIDGCRIGTETLPSKIRGVSKLGTFENAEGNVTPERKGRWPANLLLDEEAAAMLDEQSGTLKSGALTGNLRPENKIYGSAACTKGTQRFYPGSSGGASRFFYCAKTSSRERNEGLDGFPTIQVSDGRSSGLSSGMPEKAMAPQKNHHPTVKPLALMRYLITLISPSTNALILDPFAGSGSTIVAAEQLGIQAIGIEKQPEYVEIARARLKHAADKANKIAKQMELL